MFSGHKPQLQVSKNHQNNESSFISGSHLHYFLDAVTLYITKHKHGVMDASRAKGIYPKHK